MIKKAIVINDQHIPYEDKKANELVFKFILDYKPDIIDIIGDTADFWQISKFDKNPARMGSLQEDIDKTHEYLKILRQIAPDTEIELHAGNHLDRLRKYLWNTAKEIEGLRSMSLPFLLGLDELNINFIPEAEGYRQRGDLILTHGTLVSQDSAMSARRMLKKSGLSIIMGHTHRGGSVYVTDLLGTRGAWENFCLCRFDLAKEWRMNFVNWQQGFSYIYYYPDRFEVHQCPIIKGKFTALGKEYK